MTITFKGRQVECFVAWASCIEDSFIEEAYWLDVTGPDDEHPALTDQELEDLNDEVDLTQSWSEHQAGRADFLLGD